MGNALKRNYRGLVWGGLALWLICAVLYANVGPFKSVTLQLLAAAGFVLFVGGCVQRWRHRKVPARN